MTRNTERLLKLIDGIYTMHEPEVDCNGCDEQLNFLAELTADGYDPKLLLPAVQAHLDCCESCHEAFRALLSIVKAEQTGQC
jgi:hypothetical protein